MNKMDILFREELIRLLLTYPSARLSHGGNEVNLRCMYCGDSLNPNSAHMYICIMDGVPLFFHCFKCHAKGILTHDKLISWNLYTANPDLYVKLINYNKSVISLDKNKGFRDLPVYMLNNNYIIDNPLSMKKLEYINKRLGLQLGYKDLLDNKIVLNLKDVLISNNIKNITRKSYVVDQLDESFIGFISEDNAFMNLRNLRRGKVDESIDSKYTTYNIFNKFETTRNHYTLPTVINTLSLDRTKIHIAEGAFDILSIYFNLRKERNNNIYTAVGGNGYINICKYFLITMGLINVEFHIYPDNDVPQYKINDIENLCRDLNIPMYVHRNLYPDEKDFGVPLIQIQEQIQRVT